MIVHQSLSISGFNLACALFISPKIELIMGADKTDRQELLITELSHMADYCQPHAPGALLKAAFICADIVEFPSQKSLKEQLSEKCGCGFRLQTISNVPKGSGLSNNFLVHLVSWNSSISCIFVDGGG